ncbi:hypothetical protein [Deminuibacter soli]|uniref:Cytochrome P460 domain-containing protein n=1 Tax=Deminuibacter soli TaxID=2291815 RepID=A0A3E1NHQ1_9BACT|nr:hypothetical protein [Deminuibacter soli]RFM27469.1 hypothetical protein DXN05_15755 [Deminuibacter soli]
MKAKILTAAVLLLLASCRGHNNTVDGFNEKASLAPELNINAMHLKVLTTSVDKIKGTMSTLYGNDTAVNNARRGRPHIAGETLALVTWQQTDDPNWFGGRIPDSVRQVEIIHVAAGNAGIAYNYASYAGKSLTPEKDTASRQVRIERILSMRPAVMP